MAKPTRAPAFLKDLLDALEQSDVPQHLHDYGVDLTQVNACLRCRVRGMTPAEALSSGYTCLAHPLLLAATIDNCTRYACCGKKLGSPGCTPALHDMDAPLLRFVGDSSTGLSLLALPYAFVETGIVRLGEIQRKRKTPVYTRQSQLRDMIGFRFAPLPAARAHGADMTYSWQIECDKVYASGTIPNTELAPEEERSEPSFRALIAYQVGGPLSSLTEDDMRRIAPDVCLSVPFVVLPATLAVPLV